MLRVTDLVGLAEIVRPAGEPAATSSGRASAVGEQ
jgi:hypothetical protein